MNKIELDFVVQESFHINMHRLDSDDRHLQVKVETLL